MTTNTLSPFYPILPDAGWIERLVPLGIRTVQLRFKGPAGERKAQVAQALNLCRAHGCLLVVNDHWQVALEAGAEAVHLGQEDLRDADLDALRARTIAVGVSTHDLQELAIAQAVRPASIALGPIFATSTKATGRAPQGVARITEWRRRLGVVPLTVIGGISLEAAPALMAAGADSIAVVSDVTAAADPEARVRDWLAWEASLGR